MTKTAIMNKLASSVRKSLIEKSFATNKNKWSLKSLAAMSQQVPSNETAAGIPRKPGPSSLVADTLLSEINLRLAVQHRKCVDMIDQVSGKSALTLQSSSTARPKKIRAVNQPVHQGSSMKEWMDRSEKLEKVKDAILRSLNNLERVHIDTFSITEHLLSNDKPTLKRFSRADQSLLAATFEQVRCRHASTVENIADIVILMRGLDNSDGDMQLDDKLIDTFLRDRLGIQLLCDHYVGLSKGKPGGGISINCKFEDVLTDAMLEAKHICDANYGVAPEVHILNDNLDEYEITLIRPWVHHILCELFKNGMTASVQKASYEGKSAMPLDLFIRIRQNDEAKTLVCEILDQGIGIDEKGLERAFLFADSSAQHRWDRIDEQQSYAMVRQPITSLGVGLSLSQMMAQISGGSLKLEYRKQEIELLNVKISTGCTSTLELSMRDEITCNL